jgi:hypothetical protein
MPGVWSTAVYEESSIQVASTYSNIHSWIMPILHTKNKRNFTPPTPFPTSIPHQRTRTPSLPLPRNAPLKISKHFQSFFYAHFSYESSHIPNCVSLFISTSTMTKRRGGEVCCVSDFLLYDIDNVSLERTHHARLCNMNHTCPFTPHANKSAALVLSGVEKEARGWRLGGWALVCSRDRYLYYYAEMMNSKDLERVRSNCPLKSPSG